MVVAAFDEDLPGGSRDVTSSAMPPMGHGIGDLGAREPGVVAGLGVAELAFRYALGTEARGDRPARRRQPGAAPATS